MPVEVVAIGVERPGLVQAESVKECGALGVYDIGEGDLQEQLVGDQADNQFAKVEEGGVDCQQGPPGGEGR